MRARAQSFLEDRDTAIEQLEAQLRALGQQPATAAGGGGSAGAGAGGGGHAPLLGIRTAAPPSALRGAAGVLGVPAWGSAVSSASVSPSQPGAGGAAASGQLLYSASGPHGSGALAGSSGVGLTSPAFSGAKYSAGMVFNSGSPRGGPAAQQHGAGSSHSRNSSMQMQHGPSPLSGSFNRRASDAADTLSAAAAAEEGDGGVAGSLASKRSSSSSALHQAAVAAAEQAPAVTALPLSTLRLESEGSGVHSAAAAAGGGVGIGGPRLQLLPLPGGTGTSTPTAAAATAVDSKPEVTPEELDSMQPEDLKQRVLHAQNELRDWRAAIDVANARINELYNETHHIQSLYQITERDAKYLREVLVSALKSGELNATSSMLQGLSRMLHFTPAELDKIQAHSRAAAAGAGVLGGSLVGLGGWGFPGLTSPSPTTGNR